MGRNYDFFFRDSRVYTGYCHDVLDIEMRIRAIADCYCHGDITQIGYKWADSAK